MFQVSTAADPSLLAICGAIVADLWSSGGVYPWLLFAGYVLGSILLGAAAIWLMDRKPGKHGWRNRRIVAWFHTNGATKRISRSGIWRHGDLMVITIAACAFLTGLSYLGWRAAIAEGAVSGESIAAENPKEPFALIDHTGKPISEAAFRGKLALVSFGYTFCPDVCPTTLNTLSQTLDGLGDHAAAVVTAFVTVDPARDTVDVLAAFLKHFHPGIIGMTGSDARIKALARAYKVYFARTGGSKSGDDYLMEHTAWIYLVGRDGEILERFPHTATPDRINARIRAEFTTPIS